jgi:hypothetical protein
MIYTLRRGVDSYKIPVRYETRTGIKRLLPAVPFSLAMPNLDRAKDYGSYAVIPLLSLATLLVLSLSQDRPKDWGVSGTFPQSGSSGQTLVGERGGGASDQAMPDTGAGQAGSASTTVAVEPSTTGTAPMTPTTAPAIGGSGGTASKPPQSPSTSPTISTGASVANWTVQAQINTQPPAASVDVIN